MRVISGTCKGRPLKAVPGMNTRPTTDKIKESLFNIVGPYFEGGRVLDIFSGSGSLGLEALSRGMDEGVFIDKHPKAVDVIRENIRMCGMNDCTEVFRNDAVRSLKALAKRETNFNLIIMDPPYKIADMIPSLLKLIEETHLLTDDGLIICEHGKEYSPPETVEQFVRYREESYGITVISFYRQEIQE